MANQGVTESRLLEFRDDGRGVWKEHEVVNRADAEVMADRLDDALGLGIVPKTIVMEDQFGKVGSCQRFVDGVTMAIDLDDQGRGQEIYKDRDAIERMVLLDYLIGNRDRHFGNVVFDPEGRLWAVDNGQGQDWRTKGGRDWAGDIEPSVMRTNRYRLSPALLAKLKALDERKFLEALGDTDDEILELASSMMRRINARDAWTKIAKIRETGELVWP